MIQLEKDENGYIMHIDVSRLHGYTLICPYCYKEIVPGHDADIGDWAYTILTGHKEEEILTSPCGCEMSISDFCSNTIPVDELIAKPVALMNKCGYKTKYSCSGHMHETTGYLAYAHKYDDLLDYLLHDEYLKNLLNIEVNVIDPKNLVMENYEWDDKRKSWILFEDYPIEESYGECLVVRVKRKLTNGTKSRLDKMLMFRRALIRIAKWCEKTAVYNAQNDFTNKVQSIIKDLVEGKE